MHLSRIAAAIVLPLVASAKDIRGRQALSSNSAKIRGAYIVEFVPGSSFTQDRSAPAEDITVLKSFDSDAFSGASIASNTYNLDDLLQLPEVANVWPNVLVQLEPTVPESLSDNATASTYSTHGATGVDKLHARGIYGAGAIVGVVDTGIDYKHPALGGGFGSGFKVAKGHDFVGNEFWPVSGDKVPDEDPLDQQGHGTHVAGIVAGSTAGWQGVAPNATIYAYKVFSQAGTIDSATLIEAFLAAYNDGVDIITASIGGINGFSNNAWAVVASRLVDQGVVVTISAGNSGDAGTAFPSSGSSGTNVIAVASVASESIAASPFGLTFSLDGAVNTTTAGYLASTYYFPSTIVDWPVVPITLDTTVAADACTPFPANSTRLEGVIPLVRRGTCTFAVKQQNLAALGAEYVLAYNNENALVTPSTSEETPLLAMLTAEAGAAIVETVNAGGNVTADFSLNPESVVGLEDVAGGRPNIFTSWGPLYDLTIKPDIAAPGGSIYSTYLDGEFAVLSGTSMACPYIAGVAALYIGVHGGRSVNGNGFAKALAKKIIASGTALPWSDGTATDYGYSASVAQVGNGLIDAFKVINYTTSIDFEKIALNDTAYFSPSHDLTITNSGLGAVTYNLSSDTAAGVEALGFYQLTTPTDDARLKSFSELTPTTLDVEITFPDPFTLQPGESKTVSVGFTNPETKGWNASTLPIYSGKVIVSSNIGEQLSVPYLGLAANLKSEMTPIYRTTYPFSRNGKFQDISVNSSYTFNLSVAEQDFPKIYSKLKWGSTEVRWDIYEAGWFESSWTYPPIPGVNGYIGPATCWLDVDSTSVFDPALYSPNDTFTFPDREVFRNAQTTLAYHEYWWFGKLGNGSQIELGNYTMRFATLNPFGDPASAGDWSVFQTPQIQVLGKYTYP